MCSTRLYRPAAGGDTAGFVGADADTALDNPNAMTVTSDGSVVESVVLSQD
jgi:hypothetical protein